MAFFSPLRTWAAAYVILVRRRVARVAVEKENRLEWGAGEAVCAKIHILCQIGKHSAGTSDKAKGALLKDDFAERPCKDLGRSPCCG